MSAEPSRRRALRQEVIDAQIGRSAVEPISARLSLWHRSVAVVAARLKRADLHGRPMHDLLPDIEALAQGIEHEAQAWRSSLDVADVTGRVADAERSIGVIMDNLQNLRAEAYFKI